MEALGLCALGAMLPASIFIGIGLAVWEYENGEPPKWVLKLGDFLCKIVDKF